MAYIRIKFNDSASDVGSYSLILNPKSINLNDSTEHNNLRVLDGGIVSQQTFFDSREVTLNWEKIHKGVISGFSTMLATLQSYVGSLKFVNFKSVDYSAAGSLGWQKYRVIDLETKVEPGGKIKYNVSLTLSPEPV